jgi:PAS domain-containing protein
LRACDGTGHRLQSPVRRDAACLVLTPDLVIADVNQAYLDATGRERADLIGQYIFTVFPENPADPCADDSGSMSASLPAVARTRHPDAAVRYLPAVGSLNVCGD